MDSNVSKNSNSHNLFKLEVREEKLGISVKNLVKQELLSILNLYQHKFGVQIGQKTLASILDNKVAISHYQSQSFKHKDSSNYFAENSYMQFVYSCPIGLLLGSKLRQTPLRTMQQISHLLSWEEQASQKSSLLILVEIVDRGWINFYLSSGLMAFWLEKMLDWRRREVNINININLLAAKEVQDWQSNDKYFPAQYLHARCCSLLRLGERENLINQGIEAKISWLDENRLWLTTSAEQNLLQQLLVVADSWMEYTNDSQWSTLVLNLSQAIAIFLAECRFLGEVKEQPQLAIARLGLIAVVQLWLQIILNKIGVAAPESL